MRAKTHKKVLRAHRLTVPVIYTQLTELVAERIHKEEKQTYREIFGLGDVSTKSFAK